MIVVHFKANGIKLKEQIRWWLMNFVAKMHTSIVGFKYRINYSCCYILQIDNKEKNELNKLLFLLFSSPATHVSDAIKKIIWWRFVAKLATNFTISCYKLDRHWFCSIYFRLIKSFCAILKIGLCKIKLGYTSC